MKIARVQFFGVLACLTLLVIGCAKDPVTPNDPVAANRLTVNGNGLTNKKFTFPTAQASYITNADVTVVAIGDSTIPDSVDAPGTVIFFAGMTTGTFPISGLDSSVAVWVFTDSTMYTMASGTVTITQYGAVGGKIIGTFSGTGTADVNGVPVSVTITDGAFSAVRVGDNELDPDALNPTVDFSFVIDGTAFNQQLVELEQTDVVVDSAVFSGIGTYRRVIATGLATIDNQPWIVSITLQPKVGMWTTGTFPWTVNVGVGYTAAIITMIPENDVDGAMTFFATGLGGSTIIDVADGTTISGVFSGNTIANVSGDSHTISNGRFSFDLE